MSAREAIKSIARVIVGCLWPYRTVGKENVPAEGGAVLVCNHISNMDPIHLLVSQPRHIYFMAKKELFKIGLFRWLLGKIMGVFTVDRQSSDKDAVVHAIRLVQDGHMMGIFPEGTRSKDGNLARGKAGVSMIVARTGAPIVPCCILRKTKNRKLRLFCRSTIVFGKPIQPSELCLDGDRPDIRRGTRLLMERIAQLMEENECV
ncbi:MAG: 1-acyl-sn-glycerol-3-phosphate acyltransferase [Clostridia bacterium]|nr:1-acyl-sn-glycerol-3-phosphate acyltransferase [Clostridia bacterium]